MATRISHFSYFQCSKLWFLLFADSLYTKRFIILFVVTPFDRIWTQLTVFINLRYYKMSCRRKKLFPTEYI